MPVTTALDRIRRSALRLLRCRWAACAFVAGLLAALFMWPGGDNRWIVAAPAIISLAPTAARIRSLSRLLRQIRLERRFIEHAPSDDLLRRSLQHQNHLWQRSMLLGALRNLLEEPLPRLTGREEKIKYLRERFRQSFSSLRRRRWTVEIFLLLATALLWGWLLPLDVPPYLVAVASAFFAAALANEVIQQMEQTRLTADFADLERAFSEWTLDQQLDVTLRRDASKAYVHTVDYYAPAWLAEK